MKKRDNLHRLGLGLAALGVVGVSVLARQPLIENPPSTTTD